MMQAVANPQMRGELGQHYTSESNIMKVLRPLFLFSLEENYAAAQGHAEESAQLHKLLNRSHFHRHKPS
jgi:RES domain-containing protein